MNAQEKRRRDQRVYQAWLSGLTRQQIADQFDVTLAVVRRVIERLDEEAAEELAGHAKKLRMHQTYQIKHIYHEALAAWERSKTDELTTKVSTEGDGQAAGKRKAEKTTKMQVGDPRFLTLAESALATLRKLWEGEAAPAPPIPHRAQVVEDENWYGTSNVQRRTSNVEVEGHARDVLHVGAKPPFHRDKPPA